MKKLNKIQINLNKVIKEEDLLSIRGGYDYMCCLCYSNLWEPAGYMAGAGSSEDCNYLCRYAGFDHGVYSIGGTGSC